MKLNNLFFLITIFFVNSCAYKSAYRDISYNEQKEGFKNSKEITSRFLNNYMIFINVNQDSIFYYGNIDNYNKSKTIDKLNITQYKIIKVDMPFVYVKIKTNNSKKYTMFLKFKISERVEADIIPNYDKNNTMIPWYDSISIKRPFFGKEK